MEVSASSIALKKKGNLGEIEIHFSNLAFGKIHYIFVPKNLSKISSSFLVYLSSIWSQFQVENSQAKMGHKKIERKNSKIAILEKYTISSP